jgi:AcrR family transcriptional regulator
LVRPKDVKKRQAIRNAAVEEFIKGGLSGASVSKIAKRAGVSAGTIYLYFPNKDNLLQEIYGEIKQEIHACIMAEVTPAAGSATNIKAMWFALFDYISAQPNDFAFSEYVAAAQLFDKQDMPHLTKNAMEIALILQTAITEKILKPAPLHAMSAVLMAPAIQLGRRAVLFPEEITDSLLEQTFDMIWMGAAIH